MSNISLTAKESRKLNVVQFFKKKLTLNFEGVSAINKGGARVATMVFGGRCQMP